MSEKTRRKTDGAISTTKEEREKLEDGDLEAVEIEKPSGLKYRIEKK